MHPTPSPTHFQVARALEDKLSVAQRDAISRERRVEELEEQLAKEIARAERAEAAVEKSEEEVVNAGIQAIRLQDEFDVLEKENQELHDKLTAIDAEGAASMMALEEQVAMVAKLEEQLETLKAERSSEDDDRSAALLDMENQVTAQNARATMAENKMREVEDLLAAARSENKSLNAELEKARAECEELSAEMSRVNTEGAATKQALGDQLSDLTALQAQVAEQTSRANLAESAETALTTKFNALEIELKTLHLALDDAVEQNNKNEADLHSAQMGLARKAVENTELEDKLKHMHEIENELKLLQSKLEGVEQERQSLLNRINVSDALLSKVQMDEADHQQGLGACRAELEACKQDASMYKQKLEDSERNLSTAQSAAAEKSQQLENERRELSDKLSAAESGRDSAQRDLDTRTDELSACKADLEKLMASDEDSKTQQARLSIASDREKERAEKAESDLRRTEESLAHMSAHVSELEEKLQNVVNELQEVHKQHETLQNELASTKDDLSGQRKRADAAEAGLTSVQDETDQVNVTMNALEDSLMCAQAKMHEMAKDKAELIEIKAHSEMLEEKLGDLVLEKEALTCENGKLQASMAEQIAAKEAELETLRIRADVTDEKLRTVSAQNEALSAAIKTSDAENAERCREFLEQISKAEEVAAQEKKRAERLSSDLDQARNECQELVAKLSTASLSETSAAQALKDQLANETAKSREALADLQQAKARQAELESMQKVAEQHTLGQTTRADKAEAEVQTLRAEKAHLMADREALSEQLALETSRAEQLLADLKKAEEDVHHHEMQVQDLEDKLKCLGSEFDVLQAERETLSEKGSGLNDNISTLQSHVQELESEASGLRSALDALQAEQDLLTDKLSAEEANAKAESTRANGLAAKLLEVEECSKKNQDGLKKQLESETERADRTSSDLKKEKQDAHELRLQISELSAQLSALRNESETAMLDCKATSEEKILQLQEELRELGSASSARVQSLEAQIQDLKNQLEEGRLNSGERIAHLETEIDVEKSRASELVNNLQLAHTERDAQAESMQEMEVTHADRCRELADRISAADAESAKLSTELEDLRAQLTSEIKKVNRLVDEMAEKAAEQEKLEKALSTALNDRDSANSSTEILKKEASDAATELATQREKADHAVSVAERAVEQQLELAHKLEAATIALTGKEEELGRALKSAADFKEHYEASKQKVQELEQKMVDMQDEHDNEKHEIDLELTELYGLVEQQKESGDRWVSESEQYKAEAQKRRSELVLARWHYFSKLLLQQRMELSAGDSDLTTLAKRAVFAEPLEDPERTIDASQAHSQATSQDTTYEAEGFENLPPLEMSSRKRTIRCLPSS